MEVDCIIVGAGSAGSVLANRLTEDKGVRVLVLEAGGRDDSLLMKIPLGFRMIWRGPKHNWICRSAPDPNLGGRRLSLPRGKTLGGSSSINGMLYIRGHPLDDDLWRQAGCDGWSYADVLPHFRKAESNWRGESEVHGGSGPLSVSATDLEGLNYPPVEATARNTGLKMIPDFAQDPEGFGKVDLTIRDGRRASTAEVYLRPAMTRPGLTVETNALTCRVVVERGRATGVEYLQGGTVKTATARREVILCGGACNAPQLLLLSGIGPGAELAAKGIAVVHDLPGVGKNLHEHPTVAARFAMGKPITYLNQLRLDRVALAAIRWQLFRTGPLATRTLPALAFVKSRESFARPDLQLFFNPTRMDAEMWFPLLKASQGHALEGFACLLHPESRGELTLDSAGPRDPPRIFHNLLAEEADRRALVEGIRILRRFYANPPNGEIMTRETLPGPEIDSDAELDSFVRQTAEIMHHPVGTCAMGTGPMAVTDPQLRVRGIEGLRVVDASVMPMVPCGNTNAPTIMVAAKAADMTRGRVASAGLAA